MTRNVSVRNIPTLLLIALFLAGCLTTSRDLSQDIASTSGNVDGAASASGIWAETPLQVSLRHDTMKQRVGNPAIISPGEAYPSLEISASTDGFLRIYLGGVGARDDCARKSSIELARRGFPDRVFSRSTLPGALQNPD